MNALVENNDLNDPTYMLVEDSKSSIQRILDKRFKECDFDFDLFCTKYIEDSISRDEALERFMTVQRYREQLNNLFQLPKVEQKTDAWYAMRQSMITASDLAQALGKGKFGSVKQFYEKKCEERTSSNVFNEKNPFFVWGHMFEPVAIEIYSKKFGVKVHEFGLIQHPHYNFFGASPDGITDTGVLLEIKCPLKRKITGDVPLQYYYQIQGQLSATELYECDYFEAEFELCCSLKELLDVCENFEHWGIIIETTYLAPDSVLPYHYFTDVCSLQKIEEWKRMFDEKDIVNIKYWVMRKYYVRRIIRDDELVEDVISKRLRKVWENINRFKQSKIDYIQEIKGRIEIETEPLNPKEEIVSESSINGYLFLEDDD